MGGGACQLQHLLGLRLRSELITSALNQPIGNQLHTANKLLVGGNSARVGGGARQLKHLLGLALCLE